MVRSMNSAVSSLKNHQTRMDVIGNNIANVNTVAFKSGRTTFKDTYSQLTRTASGNNGDRGGINPSQVGLGMNISSIDNAMEKGNMDTTNINTDVYIDGEGFFQVKGPDGVFYTRDGNFSLDEEGYLVTKAGLYVQGYQADKDGNIVQTLDKIKVPIKDILKPKVTTAISLEGNLSSEAGRGINTFPGGTVDSPDSPYEAKPLGEGNDQERKYTLKAIYDDDSSVPRKSILGKTVTTRVVDSLGGLHTIRYDFIKAGSPNSNEWNVYAFYVKENGAMIPADGNNLSNDPQQAANGLVGKISFSDRGSFLTAVSNAAGGNNNAGGANAANITTLEFNFNPKSINGSYNPVNFKMDMSALTQFESRSDAFVKTNDGYPLGSLNGYSIGSDGKVVGSFSNGDTKALGRIVTATFSNINGLKKEGDNLWSPTENSGDANINIPGSSGNGVLIAGALEMSNVDLAKEFTNMIITQRGFQANSRVITTTDQMLEELVNLKR